MMLAGKSGESNKRALMARGLRRDNTPMKTANNQAAKETNTRRKLG
jgi:hypothetical protein